MKIGGVTTDRCSPISQRSAEIAAVCTEVPRMPQKLTDTNAERQGLTAAPTMRVREVGPDDSVSWAGVRGEHYKLPTSSKSS